MKIKSVLLAVLMSASVLAFANEPGNSRVAVVNQKSGIIKVIYEGQSKGNVKLNIFNTAGTSVYQETIKNINNFVLPLNFSGMTPGEYTIEVADNSGKKVQKVNYTASTIATSNNVRITKTGEAGKYLLAVANEGANEVNVKIYNDASELVHSQTTMINGNYGVVYNLQKISGEPTFTVTDKTGTVKVIK